MSGIHRSELPVEQEAQLLLQAKGNDTKALSKLLQANQGLVRRLIRLLIGQPDDVDDLVQDTLTQAFTDLPNHPEGKPFGRWLEMLGAGQAINQLAMQRRWRVAAQIATQHVCAEQGLLQEIMNILHDESFEYAVDEHVAFCFTAIGRSLPLDQQVCLALVDVLGLDPEDAATALRADLDAVQRYREAGRQALADLYGKLCGLVSEENPCHHCKGLRDAAPEDQRGEELDSVRLTDPDPEVRVRKRLRIVREADLDGGSTRELHDLLFRVMARSEANRESPKERDQDIPNGKARWEDLHELNN